MIKLEPWQGTNWNEPGVKSLWLFEGEAVIVRCPHCAAATRVAPADIANAAETAELVCACGFADMVQLVGWARVGAEFRASQQEGANG